MNEQVVRIPDLGTVEEASVIEVVAHTGDVVGVNDAIVVLESDKASMEIPAGVTGKIKEILLAVGDKVKSGTKVAVLVDESVANAAESISPNIPVTASSASTGSLSQSNDTQTVPATPVESDVMLRIPDLGGVDKAQVIEISVNVGDRIGENDTLMVLESEKASMEIPATTAGIVQKIIVHVGDQVSSGMDAVLVKSSVSVTQPTVTAATTTIAAHPIAETKKLSTVSSPASVAVRTGVTHAGPAVRKLAREFGIDLQQVSPSGPKQRIVKEDLHRYVKTLITGKVSNSSFDVPTMPVIDFAEFGAVEHVDLSRIKKITAINMHRNWVRIPHVTQFDEADITELESYRKSQTEFAEKWGVKLTLLPFITKAVAMALKEFPQFNASLAADGQQLVMKKYCHIGFAVDTEEGLLVPVIRHADQQSIESLAQQIKALSDKARQQKLLPSDMKGGCFTVSSLGGVGGTAFTPIINAPEVAILGVSKASTKAIYCDGAFVPRLCLPLCLSYDHRVIDGAQAAKFTAYLAATLARVDILK